MFLTPPALRATSPSKGRGGVANAQHVACLTLSLSKNNRVKNSFPVEEQPNQKLLPCRRKGRCPKGGGVTTRNKDKEQGQKKQRRLGVASE